MSAAAATFSSRWGATGVIRHLPNTAGMGAVFGVNRSEEGDVTINLAEGSMIDITEGGGAPAVVGFINASDNNAGDQTGDLFINAAGTIRTAVRNRGLHGRQGVGIRTLNDGMGVTRVTSSGTVETLHAHAIYSTHWGLTSTQRDDLNTEEIEGNLIDVTAGKVLTRGGTAIHVDTRSANAAGVVRVGEGRDRPRGDRQGGGRGIPVAVRARKLLHPDILGLRLAAG